MTSLSLIRNPLCPYPAAARQLPAKAMVRRHHAEEHPPHEGSLAGSGARRDVSAGADDPYTRAQMPRKQPEESKQLQEEGKQHHQESKQRDEEGKSPGADFGRERALSHHINTALAVGHRPRAAWDVAGDGAQR
ncbi:hypothetical protein ACFXPQ_08725 [Streptomyces lydicus]|uniref:hypothetical protein n=1 Tax=Streptomyces lydicus TaxID=47763 RepID=UPI0036B46D05